MPGSDRDRDTCRQRGRGDTLKNFFVCVSIVEFGKSNQLVIDYVPTVRNWLCYPEIYNDHAETTVTLAKSSFQILAHQEGTPRSRTRKDLSLASAMCNNIQDLITA